MKHRLMGVGIAFPAITNGRVSGRRQPTMEPSLLDETAELVERIAALEPRQT